MTDERELLSGLTVPSLSLLLHLYRQRGPVRSNPAALKLKTLCKTEQVTGIAAGAWVSDAALLDAISRDVFRIREGPKPFLPAHHLERGADFSAPLPAPLAWLPVAFNAELATWNTHPKKQWTTLGLAFPHYRNLPRDPPAGPPADDNLPAGVAAYWWPYGCPIWTAATPLVDVGWVRTGEFDGGFISGLQVTYAITSAGVAAAMMLDQLKGKPETRVKANGPRDLRPGPARMAALLLWSAEHRAPSRCGEVVAVGPDAPEAHGDVNARRAVWLANTVMVTYFAHEWLVGKRAGKLAI